MSDAHLRQALGTTLRPEVVYGGRETRSYELRALVCYYGSHYASFARTDVDDAASYPYLPPTCALRAACMACRVRAR
jgi:hypothetical protein